MIVQPEMPAQPVNEAPEAEPQETPWRRLHPLSPLLRGGVALLVIVGILFANFRDRFIGLFMGERFTDIAGESPEAEALDYLFRNGLILVALGAVLVVVALIVLFSWISWRFATFRVSQIAVESRHGVVFRSHRRAPLERIQSVNVQRPLLARILGLAKLEIVTAGQGGKVDLAYLGHADAKAVRQDILRRTALLRGAPQQTASQAPDPDQTALAAAAARGPQAPGAPAGWAPAGVTAETPEGVAGVAPVPPLEQLVGMPARPAGRIEGALSERASDFIDADIDEFALEANTLVRVPVPRLLGSLALSWESISFVLAVAAMIVGSIVWDPAMLFAIFPVGIVMASILISRFNKGFNFTLSRGHDAIRTGAGLTATTTETIPVGRVHAVQAMQPLLWRPLGWWRVRITTAGQSIANGGQNAAQNIVLPVGSIDDVLRVFETLLPGIGDEAHELEGLRDGLVGPANDYVKAGPRSAVVLWFGRRRTGVALVDGDSEHATLRIRRGALTRSLTVMPVLRAQSVMLYRPLWHRMLGLAYLQAHTVLGPISVHVRGLELTRAREFFDELADCVLRVQGGEARHIAEQRAAARDERERVTELQESSEEHPNGSTE